MAKKSKKVGNSQVVVTVNGSPITGAIEGADKASEEVAIRLAAQTKLLTPVDQGQLKNSYMWISVDDEGGFNDGGGERSTSPIRGTVQSGDAVVGTNTEYAPYQEFGTRKMIPQPHLRPAAQIVKGTSKTEIIKQINEAMEKALKGQDANEFLKGIL
jgi:HK97 gp10 family phage protein